jgi:hypothetical protein
MPSREAEALANLVQPAASSGAGWLPERRNVPGYHQVGPAPSRRMTRSLPRSARFTDGRITLVLTPLL